MRTVLIFITGFVLGILLTEMINIYGFLLYDQTVSLKVIPFLIGIVLAGIDLLLRRKSKLPNYKSSLH
ncbi:putative Ca2+/H+ antiporter (TMEM165/GDT1 family) [Neobacillus niacini]|jgi:putative Ca2+/H+ antiporter (TMEM165/GDT1 family)|uniref:DUF5957 family protein n=1 Tax=Neobacillus driksii TaxID=3035913 RepID=UPI0027893A54|nr:DUF5957 family protein [Neobacillus niacini]MDQ0971824.1 putative Ca2+/H+ antiporter (TMEM165/GDT1 family) [Neobacillus niacini]